MIARPIVCDFEAGRGCLRDFPGRVALGGRSGVSCKGYISHSHSGLPQGVDLDKHIGPQTWTMAAQLDDWGLYWESGPYPYGTNAFYDPTNVPGFEYPVGYTTQKIGGRHHDRMRSLRGWQGHHLSHSSRRDLGLRQRIHRR